MTLALYIIAGALGYLAIAGAFAYWMALQDGNIEEALAIGILWPMTLPCLMVVWPAVRGARRFKAKRDYERRMTP